MADADHFLLDMSSIAGNPAKGPFLLRTMGLNYSTAIRGIAAGHDGGSEDAKLQSPLNMLLAYFV
jgi:hypothetical protein